MVAAAIRTVFAQPDADHVRSQLDVIAGMLGRQSSKLETTLRDAADDVTAFAEFPVTHGKKIWSTNPLERVNKEMVNKEIKRRTDVVGVFPNPAALLRLAGSVLVETHDEWQASDRRYLSECSVALLDMPTTDTKRWPDQHYSRHDLTQLADPITVKISYTTGRDVTRPTTHQRRHHDQQ